MSLSSLIEDRKSPLAVFLTKAFPSLKGIQSSYLRAAPPLQLPPCAANPGTIGTAFDWRVRLFFDLHPDVRLPLAGALKVGRRDLHDALVGLLAESGFELSLGVVTITQGSELTSYMAERDELWLDRFAWVLALYTELFRSGGLFPGSALDRIGPGITPDDLLSLAPDEACEDIAALAAATRQTLLPVLDERGAVVLGPTFAGSTSVGGADADMCAAGLLVELKSSTGDKRSDGTRRCSLGKDVIFQILGYMLLDWDDEFALDSIALYAARFDYLATWSIEKFVADLRHGLPPSSIADLRSQFRLAIVG